MWTGGLFLGVMLSGALEGAGASGAAGGDARILVVTAEGAEARAEELYAGLRAAGLLPASVEERAGVDLPPLPDPVPGTKDGARAALQDARGALRELDPATARARADAALDDLVRLERPEDALDLFADVLLFRANLALVEGRADDAAADLLLLSRLEPARTELHPGLYPPSLVEAYAQARADPADAGRATLVVRARAADFVPVRVLVDGRTWEGAPLAPGPHLLTLRAEGATPRSEVRTLDPSSPLILEPFLAPPGASAARAAAARVARTAPTDPDRLRALERLSLLCAARAVVLERDNDLVLFVPGRPLTRLRPPATDGASVGRAVLAALQPPRTAGGADEPEDGGPSPALVWGAVTVTAAVVVLGAVGGVIAWAVWPPEDIEPPPRPVVIAGPTD